MIMTQYNLSRLAVSLNNTLTYQEWKNEWIDQIHKKLHELQRWMKLQAYISNRKHDSIMRRFRIGHTCITHGYLLRGELAPECIRCNEHLTVKLILDCIDFANIKPNFFQRK